MGVAQGGIAVMGAGAVGCYYGARLATGGEAVTLIGRPPLVASVTANGLSLNEGGTVRRVAVAAMDSAAGVAGADIVLVCVKFGDIEAAGQAMAPHLSRDATILALQNGMGAADRLGAVLGRPVLPGVVYAAVGMEGPAAVRHNGGGRLILPAGPEGAAVAARLAAAGVEAVTSSDFDAEIWTKFTINCAINALSALPQMAYGPLVAVPGVERLMREVTAECRAVAAASGAALPDDLWQRIVAVPQAMPGQLSSMAQDLARGRRTEVEVLNAELVRRADRLGLPAPANHALAVLVALAERRDHGKGDAPITAE